MSMVMGHCRGMDGKFLSHSSSFIKAIVAKCRPLPYSTSFILPWDCHADIAFHYCKFCHHHHSHNVCRMWEKIKNINGPLQNEAFPSKWVIKDSLCNPSYKIMSTLCAHVITHHTTCSSFSLSLSDIPINVMKFSAQKDSAQVDGLRKKFTAHNIICPFQWRNRLALLMPLGAYISKRKVIHVG